MRRIFLLSAVFSRVARAHSMTSSAIFYAPKGASENVFRGTIDEYLSCPSDKKHLFSAVEIAGSPVSRLSSFRETDKAKDSTFRAFLQTTCMQKIEHLDLLGCDLSESAGYELSLILKDPACALKTLKLTSSQINVPGMVWMLQALRENERLQHFYARSYNVERRTWCELEVTALAELIATTRSLERIDLPNNRLADLDFVDLLRSVYRTGGLSNRPSLPVLSGLASPFGDLRDFSTENFGQKSSL